MKKSIIYLKETETPLGKMTVCATDKGICLLEFSDIRTLEAKLKTILLLTDATLIHEHHKYFENAEQELSEYFTGQRKSFTVPLHITGTDFQNKVWTLLQKIPYGNTKSYKEQAIAIGSPKSIRAVAGANAMNRISILIPCHRVMGSDGQLTGYSGGLWRKKYLLDLERQHHIEHLSLLF